MFLKSWRLSESSQVSWITLVDLHFLAELVCSAGVDFCFRSFEDAKCFFQQGVNCGVLCCGGIIGLTAIVCQPCLFTGFY